MFARILLFCILVCLFGFAEVGVAAEGHDPLPPFAERITPQSFPIPITNSMLAMWLVVAVIVIFAQLATRKMTLIPSGLQNFAEWLVESLYNFLEGILGEHLVKRTFWFFGTIFIMILFANWMALVPGVGTVGIEVENSVYVQQGLIDQDDFRPLLRGANADLNLTLAMALIFALLWFYWAVTENGLKGFLAHIFAPKGVFNGIMKVAMIAVFFLVGVIEVASILLRPVALSFRLYGNIFAGENILEAMMELVGDYKFLAWLPPIPFYFLELLVGLIQALVFMLLTAVFLKLICEHDEEHGH